MTEQAKNPGTGRMVCRICKGKGKIMEDSNEYEFLTRDPVTSRCLICDGSGVRGTRTTLPDGRRMSDIGKGWLEPKEKSPVPPATTLERRGIKALASQVDSKKKAPAEGGSEMASSRDGEVDVERFLWLPLIDEEPLTVETDHPMYLELLRRLRAYEIAKGGNWEPEDEARYVEALERELGLEEV